MTALRTILPAARDQGDRETCLSIALSDGHHAARGAEPSLAADYLHFKATVVEGVGVNEGVSVSSAMLALEDDGQPAETECPYSPKVLPTAWKPPPPTGQLWRHRTAAGQGHWNTIAAHVGGGRPVVVVMAIDDAFWTPIGGVVEAPSGQVRASQAVLGVAIANQAERLLVRNSWGPEWGDGGYAWLSFVYVAARCKAVITFNGAVT